MHSKAATPSFPTRPFIYPPPPLSLPLFFIPLSLSPSHSVSHPAYFSLAPLRFSLHLLFSPHSSSGDGPPVPSTPPFLVPSSWRDAAGATLHPADTFETSLDEEEAGLVRSSQAIEWTKAAGQLGAERETCVVVKQSSLRQGGEAKREREKKCPRCTKKMSM